MVSNSPEEFDPQAIAGLSPPFFIRKVDRPPHWRGGENDSHDDRIRNAIASVFPSNQGAISIFRVETINDFVRVAIGLNSYRSSLREELVLLCILPDELSNAGLRFASTTGDTKCEHANACHYDVEHDENALRHLVENLVTANRDVIKLKRKRMVHAVDYASSIGCRATESTLSVCLCREQKPD